MTFEQFTSKLKEQGFKLVSRKDKEGVAICHKNKDTHFIQYKADWDALNADTKQAQYAAVCRIMSSK